MKQTKYILILLLLVFPLFLSGQGIEYRFFGQKEAEGDAKIDMTVERVFVHTDRDIYVSGEDMLYSLYLLDSVPENSNERSIVGYIELINDENSPVTQSRFGIYKGYSFGKLNLPDSLATGEYLLRAYTRHMRSSSPELLFTQPVAIYNPFKENKKLRNIRSDDTVSAIDESRTILSKNINLTGSIPENFKPREEVTLRFQVDPTSFTNPDLSKISASIAIPSGLNEPTSIYEFLTKNQEVSLSSDNSQSEPENQFSFKEVNGPYLEGSIISRETLNPVAGERLYLSLPGKSTDLQYSTSDKDGKFRFILPPLLGIQELIIQPADFSDNYLIKTATPFANKLHYTIGNDLSWDAKFLDYSSRLGVNYQVNKIYEFINSNPDIEQNQFIPALRFYGEPDIQIILADYIELPTIEEVFHELIPGVALRKQGEGSSFVFVNEITGDRRSTPGAIFLDGVIIDDPSFIAAIDPELIERIDIIKRNYQIGDILINGLINIVSIEGDMCGIDYPNSGLRTATTILDERYTIRNLNYSDTLPKESRLPDFRNTLYWDPQVKTDDSGIIELTFYTSDFLSDYSITLQGITDNDQPIFFNKSFKVVKD